MSAVDKFFDQLGDILKTLLGGDSSSSSFSPRRREKFTDPDMQAAWEELNDYLDEEESFEARTRRESQSRSRDPFMDRKREALRQDYATLEVPFGAPFEEVKKAYKHLLRRYHPDLNSGDPEKLRIATEITKKINISYRRIKDFELSGEKSAS